MAVALLAAGPAHATVCVGDSDCPRGFSCQVVQGTNVSACEPAPCHVAADCGDTMVCFAEVASTCDGLLSPPPGMCMSFTKSTCVFKWQFACATDADCGNGAFRCDRSGVIQVCSPPGAVPVDASADDSNGSADGGVAAMSALQDAGTLPVPTGLTCKDVMLTDGSCVPQATSCLNDSDCPSYWVCLKPQTVVPGTPPLVCQSTLGWFADKLSDYTTPADGGAAMTSVRNAASAAGTGANPSGVAGGANVDGSVGTPAVRGTGGAGGSTAAAGSTAAGCAIGGHSSDLSDLVIGALVFLAIEFRRRKIDDCRSSDSWWRV